MGAHTGTRLFKECLLGLLGSKTVIYVTHQVEFLPAADLILVSNYHFFSSLPLFPLDKLKKCSIPAGHERWKNYTSWKVQ